MQTFPKPFIRDLTGAKSPRFAVEYRPAIGSDNRVSNSAQLLSKAAGRTIRFRVQFRVMTLPG